MSASARLPNEIASGRSARGAGVNEAAALRPASSQRVPERDLCRNSSRAFLRQIESALAEVRVVIERMHGRCGLRQRFGEGCGRRGRSAERRNGRSVHERPRHRLATSKPAGRCRDLFRRNARSVRPRFLLLNQPNSPPSRVVLCRLEALSLRLFGELAGAPCLCLCLLALAAVRLFDRGVGACSSAAALDPPVPQPLHKAEADRRPLPGRIEGKRRREIERDARPSGPARWRRRAGSGSAP